MAFSGKLRSSFRTSLLSFPDENRVESWIANPGLSAQAIRSIFSYQRKKKKLELRLGRARLPETYLCEMLAERGLGCTVFPIGFQWEQPDLETRSLVF
jgi:hypothetical protein